MRPPIFSPIGRIGVRPDQPRAVVGPRKRGSRRPHTDATVAAVRDLVEGSVLTYTQIAHKTGVAQASICRWTRDGQWKRPLFAPRATDRVPSARAGARLKARTLSARLQALAERHICELENAGPVDAAKLAEALELVKMAKLAARPKKRRVVLEALAGASRTSSETPPQTSAETLSATWDAGPRAVMRSIRSAGVNPDRAPEAALEDFIESRKPPPEKRRRSRGGRFRSDEYHAWLREE